MSLIAALQARFRLSFVLSLFLGIVGGFLDLVNNSCTYREADYPPEHSTSDRTQGASHGAGAGAQFRSQGGRGHESKLLGGE